MKSFKQPLGLILALCLLPVAAWADTLAELDSYFQELYPADQPGANIIISREGQPIYRQAFGMADMALDVPNRTEMIFQLGSITKQFTAVAIMMLEQEGKLKLDDDITQYLPNYTKAPSTITVEHLLTHTSGIPNYTSIEGWIPNKIRMQLTDEQMMDEWESLPLEFEPGSKFAYSNSGYYMLGAIIAAVSGMTYAEFVENRMFKPLDMNDSYYDFSERILHNHASGYAANPDGSFSNAAYLDMGQPGAAGALASTIDDMARWDASLYTDALLTESSREQLWVPYQPSDGSDSDYGYGWSIGERNGTRVIHHGGGIFGFSTAGYRLPEQQIYIAVLSNGAASPPGVAGGAAVKAMLGEPFRQVVIELSPSELQSFTGSFTSDEGQERSFVVEDGILKLMFTPQFSVPLTPLEGGLFNSLLGELRFGGDNNNVEYVEVLSLVGEPVRWQKQ